ncbi:MAG: hypothetical protein H7067_07650 [Burkholderiales bacterium]|nr:hypothetical protein [Opitutaceae bacterium]
MNSSSESPWSVALFWLLLASAGAMLAGLAWAVGASQGAERVRQQAIDEGYAVRDPEFRWKSSDELTRHPTRSSK